MTCSCSMAVSATNGKRLFVEARFRHYSNAGLAHPNRSVDATVASVGYAF